MPFPRNTFAAAVAVLFALLAAPAAHAVTVEVGGPTLYVTAAAGERNDLDLSLVGGRLVVAETGPMVPVVRGWLCDTSGCSSSGVTKIVIDAGDGADRITVRTALPTEITDGAGDDEVTGGTGADIFMGSPGDDRLTGGTGNDTFGDAGGLGADTLAGGVGTDTAEYAGRTSGVSVTLDDQPGDGLPGEADDVQSTVENVRGGSGPDRLTGGAANNELTGNGGDDVFDGRGGQDRYIGNAGRDTADYSARGAGVVVDSDGAWDDGTPGENDRVDSDVEDIVGGHGADTLGGTSGANTLDGGPGADTINANNGDDRLLGGPGDDRLNGGDQADDLFGGDGEDLLSGGNHDDELDGGSGEDELLGGSGTDVLDYRTRTEPVTVNLTTRTAGTAGERDRPGTDVEGAYGGSAGDRLTGGAYGDRFDGGPGDDVLDGAGGGDRMVGGPGWDHVDYSSRRSGVTVSLNDSADDGSGERDDVRSDVEEVTGGAGSDRITGAGDGEVLRGGAGNDVLRGSGGDDRLEGADGADDLGGGAGNDTLDGADDADDLSGDSGNDTLVGGGSRDELSGSDGDDTLDAGDGDDKLDGGSGNDGLLGGLGADTLSGSSGNDSLVGHGGHDRLDGHDGHDTLDAGDGDDKLYGHAGDDVLDGGVGNDQLSASSGDDRVLAGPGNDKASGEDGSDVVEGGDGADSLSGSSGSDTLDGGFGEDQLDGGNDADLVRGGPDGDQVRGSSGDDRLEGGDGADLLQGADGHDVFVGGPGPDTMKGDGGEDTVDYAERGAGVRISNDGKADDGEPGEGDNVDGSIDRAIGGAGDDTIRFSSDYPHHLYGEGGNDLVEGGDAPDVLHGGPGNDRIIGRGGRDSFEGGPGADRVSGTDGAAETLSCGPGRDTAVKDKADKVVSCEVRKIGKTTSSAPKPRPAPKQQAVSLPSSPGRRTGVRRVSGGGRFVQIPGFPGESIDRRLLRDIAYLRRKYKIHVTDGFAMSGHAWNGDHPRGLGLDIVPGAGGSWAHIDRLARWAEPRQNRPRSPFRWVGYNGDSGHGRGHHLHLSWNGASSGRGRPARWVDVMSFARKRSLRRARAPRVSSMVALAGRSNFSLGRKPSVRTGLRGLARCRGAGQLVSTWKAAGRAFGIRWTILAGITEIESGHGCNMGPSSAGAIGWTQFMPATWREWGMDASGDGKASPYNSTDAIFSSARYLRASGAPGSYRRALFAYNHATWYVNSVLARAKKYR